MINRNWYVALHRVGSAVNSTLGAGDGPARLSPQLNFPITVEDMPVVKFVKENKEIEVPSGANLRQEAMKAGINVHQGVNGFGAGINKLLNCHGIAQCGTCRVKITKGMDHASPMGLMEKLRFHNPVPDPIPCLAY